MRISVESTIPPAQPGDRADQRADGDRDEGGEETDLQRGLAALHQLAEDVEAVGVRAERVPGARRVMGVDRFTCIRFAW